MTTFNLPESLSQQLAHIAHQRNLPQEQIVAAAMEAFITALTSPSSRATINQGDVFWVQPAGISRLESEVPHPHVIIQDDLFNHSRLESVVTCALTTNLKRASYPGNLMLDIGEANLPKASVVEVSKISAVSKAHLGAYIGSLGAERIAQILAGIRFLQTSYFTP